MVPISQCRSPLLPLPHSSALPSLAAAGAVIGAHKGMYTSLVSILFHLSVAFIVCTYRLPYLLASLYPAIFFSPNPTPLTYIYWHRGKQPQKYPTATSTDYRCTPIQRRHCVSSEAKCIIWHGEGYLHLRLLHVRVCMCTRAYGRKRNLMAPRVIRRSYDRLCMNNGRAFCYPILLLISRFNFGIHPPPRIPPIHRIHPLFRNSSRVGTFVGMGSFLFLLPWKQTHP